MIWSNKMWTRLKMVCKNIEIQSRHYKLNYNIYVVYFKWQSLFFTKSVSHMFTWYNLDDITEGLMEDLDDMEASNHEDSDIEDIWEPESLQKEYNENADDDITARKQYERVYLLVNQLTKLLIKSKLLKWKTPISYFPLEWSLEKTIEMNQKE